MNIFKSEPFVKGKSLLFAMRDEQEATEYVEQYIQSFIKKVYGEEAVENFKEYRNEYVMDRDRWSVVKDSLAAGHYFVERDEIGYDIYCVYNVCSNASGWLGEYTVRESRCNKIHSIFCESSLELLARSFLDVSRDVENEERFRGVPIVERIAKEAAEVYNKFYGHDPIA